MSPFNKNAITLCLNCPDTFTTLAHPAVTQAPNTEDRREMVLNQADEDIFNSFQGLDDIGDDIADELVALNQADEDIINSFQGLDDISDDISDELMALNQPDEDILNSFQGLDDISDDIFLALI
jgi:hypothetical protein